MNYEQFFEELDRFIKDDRLGEAKTFLDAHPKFRDQYSSELDCLAQEPCDSERIKNLDTEEFYRKVLDGLEEEKG